MSWIQTVIGLLAIIVGVVLIRYEWVHYEVGQRVKFFRRFCGAITLVATGLLVTFMPKSELVLRSGKMDNTALACWAVVICFCVLLFFLSAWDVVSSVKSLQVEINTQSASDFGDLLQKVSKESIKQPTETSDEA